VIAGLAGLNGQLGREEAASPLEFGWYCL
jgi:hypothetical protein